MKKTIITILVVVALAIGCFSVYANNEEKKELQKIEQLNKKATKKIETIESKPDLEQILRANGCYEDEIKRTMSKYIEYTTLYEIDDATISFFIEKAQQGYEVEKFLDIYNFLFSANKNYSKMEEMYQVGKLNFFQNHNWIENAYNSAFQRDAQVLKTEDVGYYIDQGLTFEDVALANKLSFKEVLGIRVILDRRVAGESFENIAKDISPSLQLKNIEEPEMLNAIKVGEIIGEVPTQVFDKNEEMKISKKANKKYQAKKGISNKKIKDKNYEYFPHAEEIKSIAKQKVTDIDDEELSGLLSKGYGIKEIEKGSKNAKKYNVTIEEAILYYNE